MIAFDPTSTEYQVDPRYPPSKELSWHFPKEDDGWMMAHNALRGEIACMNEAIEEVLKRGIFQQWEIQALQKMWKSHHEHVHAHHHTEDDKFQPKFEARFRFPKSVRKKGSTNTGESLLHFVLPPSLLIYNCLL
jgi:hypothetical protein